MVTDLPSQIQSISPKPDYAIIVPYTPNRAMECIYNPHSRCRQGQPENGDFGGHFSVRTAANGTASEATQNMTQFIPWDYPNPAKVLEIEYKGHLMEIRPEILEKIVQKDE